MESTVNHSGKGILNLEASKHKYALTRHLPSPDLRLYIKHFWIINWDLSGQAPYSQIVIPHPNVNLVFEQKYTYIHGTSKKASSSHLEGQGWVFGIKFRPGGFYPFWQQPVSKLTSHKISFSEVFGMEAQILEQQILANKEDTKRMELVEHFFRERLPEPDDNVELINRIVDTIIEDQRITRVEDLVSRFGIHMRTMQRLFSRYVGVSPKWVIQRHRLHDAAEQIEKGQLLEWSKLSVELGYYDQAHFIKSFKAIIGKSPEEYVRKLKP
ncbi:DNA-binding transcriptional activator FeaR [compost metagenome]